MADQNQQDANTTTEQPTRVVDALKVHVSNNKVDVALWLTRVFTILFSLGYFMPIFNNAYNAYHKALLSSAATSALRLHQRLSRGVTSRETIAMLIKEDSCHYLLYSIIFLYATPISLVVIPVLLFAVLHASSYFLTLLDIVGRNSCWFFRLLISLVELQSRNILRIIALTEILLMPTCVFMIFLGRVGLLTPVMCYYFLVMRYSSRRNPYTRNMFRELRERAEKLVSSPMIPPVIKNVVHSIIAFICRLAPAPQPAQD